ncbi:SprT-like domain-containing protein [Myxococcota bacterium]|nr:SprT-like domain-containing protein [Myxococcota bacterium]
MHPADLDAALLRELARAWNHHNLLLFRGGMRPPAFTLVEGEALAGQWRRTERTIGLSRSLLRQQPWTVVVEVLKHEMAHQYVHEVLQVVDESAHGPAFQRICARLGIDPRARGLPVGVSLDPERERVLAKVQRLLALAESDNRHEAEAAMARAHALMRKHNIAWAAQGPAPAYVFRQIGQVRARVPAHERVLAGLLASHFFVESIWVWAVDATTAAQGKVLELSGTPENVALAEHVHAFLLRAGERLWAADPVGGARAKGRFLVGVMMGFDEKLRAQARACEQQEGLVWVGDPGLQDFVGRRHPRLRTVSAGSVVADDAWASGRQAGLDIVLHRPVSQDPARRGLRLGVGE